MIVTLIARDVAHCNILEKVRVELHQRGHEVQAILEHGKDCKDFSDESIIALVASSHLVLSGMSSRADLSAKELLATKVARENNIPYGFTCDIFDCHKRPWFEPVRDKASFVFTISEGEAIEARTFFPNARVVGCGNPCWDEYFDLPDPGMVAKLAERCGAVGTLYSWTPMVVLAVGGKDPMINGHFFGGIVSAINQWTRQRQDGGRVIFRPTHIVLSLHPGDPTDPSAYNSLSHKKEIGGVSRVPVLIDKGTKADDWVGLADMVVVLGSQLGILAACQRKPVVHYFTELYRNRLQNDGGWPWKPCEIGIAGRADNEVEFADYFDCVRLGKPDAGLRGRQEKVFPKPQEKGMATKAICDALEVAILHRTFNVKPQ